MWVFYCVVTCTVLRKKDIVPKSSVESSLVGYAMSCNHSWFSNPPPPPLFFFFCLFYFISFYFLAPCLRSDLGGASHVRIPLPNTTVVACMFLFLFFLTLSWSHSQLSKSSRSHLSRALRSSAGEANSGIHTCTLRYVQKGFASENRHTRLRLNVFSEAI